MSQEMHRNKAELYNPYTIRKLQESYPCLNWLDYINAFLSADSQVNGNEVVINKVPKFFEKLGKVLTSPTISYGVLYCLSLLKRSRIKWNSIFESN